MLYGLQTKNEYHFIQCKFNNENRNHDFKKLSSETNEIITIMRIMHEFHLSFIHLNQRLLLLILSLTTRAERVPSPHDGSSGFYKRIEISTKVSKSQGIEYNS